MRPSQASLAHATDRDYTGLAGFAIDLRKRAAQSSCVFRPHEACDLLAVFEENQCGPELDAKRAPKPPAAGVGDLDMANARVVLKGRAEQRLGGAAVTAPGAAELKERGPLERVDLGARGLGFGIGRIHCHAVPRQEAYRCKRSL
jgi:hypothetical protein